MVLAGCWAMAGCLGNCSFEDLACQHPSPPDPCGSARRTISGGQVVASDDGGAFALSFEGEFGEEMVARRIDAAGALAWSATLGALGTVGAQPFAVGDTLVVVLGDGRIYGFRDGAVAFMTNAPAVHEGMSRCRISTAVAGGDGLVVVGSAYGDDGHGGVDGSTLVGCSYRVGRDGSVGDALVLASATYGDGFMPGVMPAIVVSTGGYALGTQDQLLRYDATGALLWQDAIFWPGPIVESGGVLYVLAGAGDLERIRGDGTSDPAIVSWPTSGDFRVLDIVPVLGGVVVSLELAQSNALALVGEHGLVWQIDAGRIDHVAAGATHFVVEGSDLRDFDLDGHVRWTRALAVAAAAADDGTTLVLERTAADMCTEAARLSRIGGDGTVVWSTSFAQGVAAAAARRASAPSMSGRSSAISNGLRK